MYYFYIIRSLKNQKLYLGSTPDLKERIKSHNAGKNKATKPNIPYDLIYFKTTSGWKRLHRMLEDSLK